MGGVWEVSEERALSLLIAPGLAMAEAQPACIIFSLRDHSKLTLWDADDDHARSWTLWAAPGAAGKPDAPAPSRESADGVRARQPGEPAAPEAFRGPRAVRRAH